LSSPIAFFDLETSGTGEQIINAGAVTTDGRRFRDASAQKLTEFLKPYAFISGHNIVKHDLPALHKAYPSDTISADRIIDTLLLSPLLFPNKPYHHLLKDEKLDSNQLNNPVLDSEKAQQLLEDEMAVFRKMSPDLQRVLASLFYNVAGFQGFFRLMQVPPIQERAELVRCITRTMAGKICSQAPVDRWVTEQPVAFAYALSSILSNPDSIAPRWLLINYPVVQAIVRSLNNTPCIEGCAYCNHAFDPVRALNKYFKFPGFRKYEGEALQENAIHAALNHKSLLAIFPTGGGKSITFQLPALMAGDASHELTVVISPLQSLMKDQVDNLDRKGIQRAVAINGLLDPLERANSIKRVLDGDTSLLYIAPESLRSTTIERILMHRQIARVVIDEAHCFSSWGQDFRVDYLYIAPFLKKLQVAKKLDTVIPISCFTATAKQKVIEDITAYFKKEMGLTLELFRTTARRTNLSYQVFENNDETDKYNQLRSIIEEDDCPTIIYVSRTKKAEEVSNRLNADGFPAHHFHGKMDARDKMQSQEQFMNGTVNIMVATSAFGMGVDKDNVGRVIHYEISDSLENYVQEAGRAGRDEQLNAKCFVLFNESDLDAHFNLLQQSKITKQEINQIWRAIKDMTSLRMKTSNSALDIARKAGWDDNIRQLETRVKTAVAALEMAGYIARGQNAPRVYATSIRQKNADEAISQINASQKITADDKQAAVRIVKKLFSARSKRLSFDDEAEARVDYIADQLGMKLTDVIRIINALREMGILADEKDLTAFVKRNETQNRLTSQLEKHSKIEHALIAMLDDDRRIYNLKEISEEVERTTGINPGPSLRSIIHFWGLQKLIDFKYEDGSRHHVRIACRVSIDQLKEDAAKRHFAAGCIANYLLGLSKKIAKDDDSEEVLVEFSVLELREEVQRHAGMFPVKIGNNDVENALFYLTKIDALKIEGGFMVTHNRLQIERLETNKAIQYKEVDYESLKTYYKQKMSQIHIVGEYARLMASNYEKALKFVDDYFSLNYSSFLSKYFNKARLEEIDQPLNPKTFKKIFGELSPAQLNIVKDKDSQHLVVAAGPGSGKTKVLVHKLASLLLVEEVKQEQLLMLTFSRAAATEFKSRLLQLIGQGAGWVEIKTFHSYCFDLLDKIGSLEGSENIVALATQKILAKEIEANKITKTVLVVDEAQDMNESEYQLVEALMTLNDDMRTILVGDDDQNIFEFRKASSKYMRDHIIQHEATKFELLENYRSKEPIVSLSNRWAAPLPDRLKTIESQSMVPGQGFLEVRQWTASKLVLPAVDLVLQAELSGTTAVLTQTNEQADMIVGMLKHRGRPAKLVQGNDGFSLSRLLELAMFTELVNSDTTDATIPEELWQEARRKLRITYARSANLELVITIIDRFASVNPTRKYKTDWARFLAESKLEDFVSISSEVIMVSTIHKSKGREYDNVFLVIEQEPMTDEKKRAVYVGMTRAKSSLWIGYNGTYLRKAVANLGRHVIDSRVFPDPPKISLTLGHSDVYLGGFRRFQSEIGKLMPGDALRIGSSGLVSKEGKEVLRFSHAFKETLEKYAQRHFVVEAAGVNHIVYWWDEEQGKDIKVVLPELVLGKRS
jgi:ATP-dependent DNA helicase RecQ